MWEKILAGYFLICGLAGLWAGLRDRSVERGAEVWACSILGGVFFAFVAGAVLVLISP